MEFNDVQYDCGDVIIRPAWESPDFFLIHGKVLSEKSTYFRALLEGPWSKPRSLASGEGGRRIWTLYLKHDNTDSQHANFVLSEKVSAIRSCLVTEISFVLVLMVVALYWE